MKDIKPIIAKNITDLRLANGMTQLELAEKLNYSDKAVSKWERGESVPDITVLKEIADLFAVSLDYLVHAEHAMPAKAEPKIRKTARNRVPITGMSILLVWLVATLTFVVLRLSVSAPSFSWLAFIWALPVSVIVWLVFNSIWFNARRNFLIVSLLMWTLLVSLYLTLLSIGWNVWLIFILGVPGQIIIFLWSKLKPKS